MFGLLLGSIGLNAVNGYMQSRAAKKAADAQVAATEQARGILQEGYGQQRGYQQPFLQGGQDAFNTLSQLNQPGGELTQQFRPENLQADPGTQLRLQAGQQALERAAAARGLSNSGGTLKALVRYNQDYTSQEYGNAFNRFEQNQNDRFNRLAALSGFGQQAAGTLTNAAGNYGAQSADLATQAGNARASGYIGAGNAWSNALGGAGNAVTSGMSLRALQQMQPPAATTGPVIYPNLNQIPLPPPVRY